MAMFIALDKVKLVKDAGDDNTRMRIVAHDAMDMLRKGEATRGHLQMVIEACNMTDVLARRFGLGTDWLPEIEETQACLQALAERGVQIGRYVLKANELTALNLLMEVHDAQLDACSIRTLGEAVEYIRRRIAANDVAVLPTIKEAA